MDSLGKDFRKEFMLWFCSRLLREHNQTFQLKNESSQMPFVEQRYLSFKKVWLSYSQQYSSLFPEDWKLGEQLCEEFCLVTK